MKCSGYVGVFIVTAQARRVPSVDLFYDVVCVVQPARLPAYLPVDVRGLVQVCVDHVFLTCQCCYRGGVVVAGNHGIIASKRCNDVSIQNNVVYDNKEHGIMLHRSSDMGIIRNNTVTGSGSACIAIFESFGETRLILYFVRGSLCCCAPRLLCADGRCFNSLSGL